MPAAAGSLRGRASVGAGLLLALPSEQRWRTQTTQVQQAYAREVRERGLGLPYGLWTPPKWRLSWRLSLLVPKQPQGASSPGCRQTALDLLQKRVQTVKQKKLEKKQTVVVVVIIIIMSLLSSQPPVRLESYTFAGQELRVLAHLGRSQSGSRVTRASDVP